MKCYETEHYRFHYGGGTKAEEDIRSIAAGQEECFRYVCKVLKTVPAFKIQYYLCDSAAEVGRIYGDNEPCNGFAVMPDTIYAVYNEQVQCIGFHEDAHLISYTLNWPDCPAVKEGLAMYFDRKWWGISNLEWAGYYLKKNGTLPVAAWLNKAVFFEEDCSLTYPVMGAFTEYLVTTYGLDAYLRLYRQKNMGSGMKTVYGKTPEQLQEEFERYVGLFRLDSVVEARMEDLLGG